MSLSLSIYIYIYFYIYIYKAVKHVFCFFTSGLAAFKTTSFPKNTRAYMLSNSVTNIFCSDPISVDPHLSVTK